MKYSVVEKMSTGRPSIDNISRLYSFRTESIIKAVLYWMDHIEFVGFTHLDGASVFSKVGYVKLKIFQYDVFVRANPFFDEVWNPNEVLSKISSLYTNNVLHHLYAEHYDPETVLSTAAFVQDSSVVSFVQNSVHEKVMEANEAGEFKLARIKYLKDGAEFLAQAIPTPGVRMEKDQCFLSYMSSIVEEMAALDTAGNMDEWGDTMERNMDCLEKILAERKVRKILQS